ncbi:D-serine dehydratase [Castellaniella defragrans]
MDVFDTEKEGERGGAAVAAVRGGQPTFWPNPLLSRAADVLAALPVRRSELDAAEDRLARWAPALAIWFPELKASAGLIESPLIPVLSASSVVGVDLPGKALIKADHALPVAGSIKARGGIHEVLAYAEKVAIADGLIPPGGDLRRLTMPEARAHFARFRIGVGSTGNLGLSIGIMASALGFKTTVHMSSDAKEWKKARLRNRGVEVVEHPGDYAKAVAAGRDQMSGDPHAHFVDDENSLALFLGYAVAARRLQKQLDGLGLTVDARHPLFVYLPCGVGGAPGGITWGLKQVYGDAVQCFFAEPVASPAFLVRMLSGEPRSVYDYGLDNRTEADGLAVAQASELVFSLVERLVSGLFTVADSELFKTLVRLERETRLRIEPSAAAGLLGPARMLDQRGMRSLGGLPVDPASVTHLFWTTGGAFVPDEEYRRFHDRGAALLRG